MELNYFMPTKIYFGRDIIYRNKDVFCKMGNKALIVTGRNSAKKNGSYDDVTKVFESLNIEYVLFDEVEENPSLETIEQGATIGKNKNVDFIIGVGGGSAMDAAKAMAVFVKNPDINADNIFCGRELENIPVVAVATTSGTGSEVTQYSIVTSNKEKTKKNIGQEIFPEVAMLDSKYTFDLPYSTTVNTAIDAFSHLVEGYLNSNSNYMSDMFAERGFELFKECFPKLVEKNMDIDFRNKVMLASTVAGILIAQTGTSLPHGMGYALTYFKNMPHGAANGVLLGEYLKIFKDKTKINKMLEILEIESIDKLDKILKDLLDINIEITKEEIIIYSESFASNKAKLKNHSESVTLEDIVKIYTNSLL